MQFFFEPPRVSMPRVRIPPTGDSENVLQGPYVQAAFRGFYLRATAGKGVQVWKPFTTPSPRHPPQLSPTRKVSSHPNLNWFERCATSSGGTFKLVKVPTCPSLPSYFTWDHTVLSTVLT